MEFQLSYFKSCKMMLWKCCTQYASNFGKVSRGHRTRKRSVFIPIPKKGNAKECSNYHTIALISHASKECSKFSKPGFSNMWTVHFQMFKLISEKAEEPEIKLPTSAGSLKKQESSRKNLFLLYWLCQSLWLYGSQETVENSERDGNTRPWPASWETYMQVRKQQLELDMEQQTGSK